MAKDCLNGISDDLIKYTSATLFGHKMFIWTLCAVMERDYLGYILLCVAGQMIPKNVAVTKGTVAM